MLLYLNSSKTEHVTNKSIAKLHNYVTDIKQEAEVINRFMTVGEWLDYEVRDAKILLADEDMVSNWIIIAACSNTVTEFLEQIE